MNLITPREFCLNMAMTEGQASELISVLSECYLLPSFYQVAWQRQYVPKELDKLIRSLFGLHSSNKEKKLLIEALRNEGYGQFSLIEKDGELPALYDCITGEIIFNKNGEIPTDDIFVFDRGFNMGVEYVSQYTAFAHWDEIKDYIVGGDQVMNEMFFV